MIQLNKLTHLQSNKELKITFPWRLNFPKYHKAQLVFLSDFFFQWNWHEKCNNLCFQQRSLKREGWWGKRASSSSCNEGFAGWGCSTEGTGKVPSFFFFFFLSFSMIRNPRRGKGEQCPSCCVDSSRVERWWRCTGSTRSLWARCIDPSQHRLLSRHLGKVLTVSSWWVYASSCLQRRSRCFVHSCNCQMEEMFLPRVLWAWCGKYNCRLCDQHLKVQPKNKILW